MNPIRMMIPVILLALAASSPVYGQSKDDLKKEIAKLKRKLYDLRIQNLRLKYQNRKFEESIKKLRKGHQVTPSAKKNQPKMLSPKERKNIKPLPKPGQDSKFKSFFKGVGKFFKGMFSSKSKGNTTKPKYVPRRTTKPKPKTPAEARKLRFAKIYKDRGRSAMEQNNYNLSVRYLSTALNYDGTDPEAYLLRGMVYYRQKSFKQAIADFSSVLHYSPNTWRAHYYRGLCNLKLANYASSIIDFNRAAKLNGKSDRIYSYRGYAYLRTKKYPFALRDFRRAIELNPSESSNYYNIACVYALKNQVREAISWLKKAVARGFDVDQLRGDKDLYNLRNHPEFKKLLKKKWS